MPIEYIPYDVRYMISDKYDDVDMRDKIRFGGVKL